jgi:fermentation-respiration switch protein FrsA (DUF1100 family)
MAKNIWDSRVARLATRARAHVHVDQAYYRLYSGDRTGGGASSGADDTGEGADDGADDGTDDSGELFNPLQNWEFLQ